MLFIRFVQSRVNTGLSVPLMSDGSYSRTHGCQTVFLSDPRLSDGLNCRIQSNWTVIIFAHQHIGVPIFLNVIIELFSVSCTISVVSNCSKITMPDEARIF